MTSYPPKMEPRCGAAAVEFAVCLPLLLLLLAGLWEVGRMTEVSNVMWNSAREASRDASLGDDNLLTTANNLLTYLQGAEPTAFGQGHTTVMKAPTITMAANTSGYMCWDQTANKELFTITYTNLTHPTQADPTGASQLDKMQFSVSVPYSSVAWSPLSQLTSTSRLSVTMTWVCMVDSPFQIAPALPAQ